MGEPIEEPPIVDADVEGMPTPLEDIARILVYEPLMCTIKRDSDDEPWDPWPVNRTPPKDEET